MEHELPASITSRVAKAALPDKAIITKDARNTLNTAASMFALYLGTTAQEIASQNKRQTLVLRDVMQALKEIDFESFEGPVEECLRAVKQEAAEKKAKKLAAQKEQNEFPDGEPEKELTLEEGNNDVEKVPALEETAAEDDDVDAGLSFEEDMEDDEEQVEAEENKEEKVDSVEELMEVDSQVVEPAQDPDVSTPTEAEEKADEPTLSTEINVPAVEEATEASSTNEN